MHSQNGTNRDRNIRNLCRKATVILHSFSPFMCLQLYDAVEFFKYLLTTGLWRMQQMLILMLSGIFLDALQSFKSPSLVKFLLPII